MSVVKEFREFAMQGNVVDMAVGVIIGGAFGKIATSLVKDVVMPPIGLLVGQVDFSTLAVTLRAKTATAAAVTINYGQFISTVVDFLIVALVIFAVIRQMNRLGRTPKAEAAAPPTPRLCPRCCQEVAEKATRCHHCTSDIGSAAAA